MQDLPSRPGLAQALLNAARRRWQHRRLFATFRDWALLLYDALVRYARRLPMPGRGRVARVRLSVSSRPLLLRLGSSDGFVLEEIFLTGVYRPVLEAMRGPVRQVIDLGANAGYSIRLWQLAWPAARVIAAEPDAPNMILCRANVALGGLSQQVHLVQACVADRPGWVRLDRSAEECAIRIDEGGVSPTRGPGAIEARTLEQILDAAGAEPVIDLFKCDIEGAEQGLFADCAGWIGRVRMLMIELHPPYSRQMFLNDLARAGGGFELVWSGVTANNDLLLLRRPEHASP